MWDGEKKTPTEQKSGIITCSKLKSSNPQVVWKTRAARSTTTIITTIKTTNSNKFYKLFI